MLDHPKIVREVLTAAGLRVPDRVERVPEGVGNHVYLAGDVVVRLGTGSDAPRFPRSVAAMRAARGRVKVPEVVFSDCNRSVFPVAVMVLERLPGEPLSRIWPGLDRAARHRMVQQVAAELRELHGLHQEDVPGADFPSPWWTARVEKIEHLLDALHPGPDFPVQWFHSMREYLAVNRHALVESPPPCVLHNDVNWGNVLVADGLLTGLIDFDDVLVGPEEEDAWDLVFTCADVDPPLDPTELRRLPGVDFAAPGAIERLRICEIENILELLTGELSWIGPPAAREDARNTYRTAFLSDDYDRLMEMLAVTPRQDLRDRLVAGAHPSCADSGGYPRLHRGLRASSGRPLQRGGALQRSHRSTLYPR